MEQHTNSEPDPPSDLSQDPADLTLLIAHLQREQEIETALDRVRARTMAMLLE